MAKPEIDDSFDEESDIEAFLERRDNVAYDGPMGIFTGMEDSTLDGEEYEADFE